MTSVSELEHRQHRDGSFGARPDAAGRVVSTIFAARSLLEGGATDSPALPAALDYLTATAIIDGGGSIDGTRNGVLPCYTGMLANLLVSAGRLDDARPLLEWIVKYQPITFGGMVYLQPSGPGWGEYLHRRYGGCMRSTTCMLGLVPTISALVAARAAGVDIAADAHLDAMRRLLIDRHLMIGRSGAVMPLSGRTTNDPTGTRWLLPAFPRDYVIDLIDLLSLAVALDVPREAMQEARELLESWRLPDGTWPMLGKRRILDAYRPESVSSRQPSAIITARVRALELG
ncbi:MAG: hypothetical protein CVT64_00625 [Actinobacteria bacterium HGW-Actinobacteria-4]|nr:MAG: hypothetical protein CVT64_00625 [Actinobacteria bacterium HGW-Actinobacteria-4]